MLHRFPHYYPAFRCIDGACRDNCCRAGWEIDIDPDTLARYRRVPGELGRRLDEQIDSSGEAPCFRLDREGVCPFLTREGLCELYLRLGPDALCEICREHPRFHSWHGPFRESGLGLCCEEACRLILTDRAPFALLEQTDPEPEEPAEDPLFLSRVEEVRRVCFAVAQDRCRTVRQRMQLLLCLGDELQELIGEGREEELIPAAGRYTDRSFCDRRLAALPRPAPAEQQAVLDALTREFARMERNRPAWGNLVEQLPEQGNILPRRAAFEAALGPEMAEYERILLYLLYRYLLDCVYDGDLLGNLQVIAACLLFLEAAGIFRWQGDGPLPQEERHTLCREFSQEVEYSDQNLPRLRQWCAEHPALSPEGLLALLADTEQ